VAKALLCAADVRLGKCVSRPGSATASSSVIAQVNAGARFIVHITPGAVRSLQLSAGCAVWLVLKTHSCHLVSS